MEAHVGKKSQSHMLRRRLQEAGFTHGESARVTLSGVALEDHKEDPQVYFCEVGPVKVVEQLEEGDGKPLPDEAVLSDLSFSSNGLHQLENVIIRTNGRMMVEADAKTKIRQEGPFARLRRVFRKLIDPVSAGSFWRLW